MTAGRPAHTPLLPATAEALRVLMLALLRRNK